MADRQQAFDTLQIHAGAAHDPATGALFTVAVKGGDDACIKLVDSLELLSHVANLGDARAPIIHAASTTHRHFGDEQREDAGAHPKTVRLSIGIEDSDDIIADLDQGLTKATA